MVICCLLRNADYPHNIYETLRTASPMRRLDYFELQAVGVVYSSVLSTNSDSLHFLVREVAYLKQV